MKKRSWILIINSAWPLNDKTFLEQETLSMWLLMWLKNQSRMCGKGVGSSLFPSDSLESHSYEFDALAHIGP